MSSGANSASERFYQREPADTRRRDRSVEDAEWIAAFLERSAVGTLATEASGQPFINSNLYYFDRTSRMIYMHTAHVGRTRANIEQNPRVCFHSFSMGRLLPAAEALEFSVEYEGVTAFGHMRIVDDPTEAETALQHLLDKYFAHLKPGEDYRPITPEELKRTTVYRIDIDSWSGKRKQVGADFPGAFER